MVITILEGKVTEKDWQLLKDAYAKETSDMSKAKGVHQTFLVQSQDQPLVWRIITHWRSQEDLGQMRKNIEIPTGVRIFQAANAEPSLEIWDVNTHAINKNT